MRHTKHTVEYGDTEIGSPLIIIGRLPVYTPQDAGGIEAFMAHVLGLRGHEGHYTELRRPAPIPSLLSVSLGNVGPPHTSHSESELLKAARPREKSSCILQACPLSTLEASFGRQ